MFLSSMELIKLVCKRNICSQYVVSYLFPKINIFTFIKASRDKRIYLFDKKQKIGEI